MLSKKDKVWLSHLSDTNKIKIIPYNFKVNELFEKQKSEIQAILGKDIEVIHKGATGMGISGYREIDLYIPVPLDYFDQLLEKLKQVYGNLDSYYLGE